MALVIEQSTLEQAQTLVDQHDVVGAWGVLAAAGDSYAAKAEHPINRTPTHKKGRCPVVVERRWFYGSLVVF